MLLFMFQGKSYDDCRHTWTLEVIHAEENTTNQLYEQRLPII